MATTIAKPYAVGRPSAVPGRRFDHLFFGTTAWIMLTTVFVGFAPTYYFAGVFSAPLPSTIIHIHGAVFSCWILLLVTQTSLVSAQRVDIHRKLGLAGFGLACLMPVLGWWAATDRLAHGVIAGRLDAYSFYIVPMTDMVIFAILITLAYRGRRDSAAHKRYIYVATVGLLIAAIARWPWSFVHRNAPKAALVSYALLVFLIGYDLWSTRRVHRATIWASSILIFVQTVRLPIGKTAAWHAFAAWVQAIVR